MSLGTSGCEVVDRLSARGGVGMSPLRRRGRSGRSDHGLPGLRNGPSPWLLEGPSPLRVVLMCAGASAVTSKGNVGAGADDHRVRPGARGSAPAGCARACSSSAPRRIPVALAVAAAPEGVNKLAIASFICGLAGIPLFGLITGLVAALLGAFRARLDPLDVASAGWAWPLPGCCLASSM